MKVKATKKGFYGRFRKIGDIFDINSEKELGSWMKVLEQSKAVEPEIDYKEQAEQLGISLVDEDGKKRSHFAVKADIKEALGEGA